MSIDKKLDLIAKNMEKGFNDINNSLNEIKGQLEASKPVHISNKQEKSDTELTIFKKDKSIREFLNEKKPEDDLQRTIYIGYYLENYEDLKSFNKRDLEDGFASARFKHPSNINVNVNKNIEKGYLMQVKEMKDNLKAWVLTNSGINFVEINQK